MPLDERNPTRRVLILDEDREWTAHLVEWLTLAGYETVVARNLDEALKTLRALLLPVALVDVGCPVGDNKIAQLLQIWPDLPCIAMARAQDTATVIKAFRQGAFDFAAKHSDPAELRGILERCFNKHVSQQKGKAQLEILWHAKEAAEAASRAKSEFLATVSHELRTPLNAIIGFSELMIRETLGPIDNNNYLAYIQDIHYSGRHLLEIINDILNLSKAEAGELELNECEVDLSELAGIVLRLVGPRARESGIELHDLIPRDLPRLWCDERKLKQMLLNLLSNAVKFTPSGGRVTICAEVNPSGMTIVIDDTGVGIPKVDLQRVLQPFVQLENALSRRHEGTGLGLTLVKAMIEIHGGAFTLESDLGRGTRATLDFSANRVVQSTAYAAAVGAG